MSQIEEVTSTIQEDQLISYIGNINQILPIGAKVSNLRRLALIAEKSRDIISYRDLSEGAIIYRFSSVSDLLYNEVSNRLEEVRTSLGLYILIDIFDDLQREYKEVKVQGKTKRRRIRIANYSQKYKAIVLGETQERRIRGERTRESNIRGVSSGERPDNSIYSEDQLDQISKIGITRRRRIQRPRRRYLNEADRAVQL